MVFAVIGLQLCNQKLLIQWQQYKTSSPCQRVDFFLSCCASINIFYALKGIPYNKALR